MKLYIYDHCPYCTKARSIFGLKQLPVELVTLSNDDETTPTRLIGKKMVPILQMEDGTCMPESMDIVRFIDAQGTPVLTGTGNNATLAHWLEEATSFTNPLSMPRWISVSAEGLAGPFLAEFKTDLARRYFVKKKEAYLGSFSAHQANSPALIAAANAHLEKLAPLIRSPKAVHEELSEDDLHLFARLRSLSIVKGLHYPPQVEAYRQAMSLRMAVPLHDTIAR